MSHDNTGGMKADRQSKHLQIDSSLNRLENVTTRLGQFISDIHSNEIPAPKNTSDKAERPIMTLSDFLQHTPTRIDSLTDKIEGLISEARELLF